MAPYAPSPTPSLAATAIFGSCTETVFPEPVPYCDVSGNAVLTPVTSTPAGLASASRRAASVASLRETRATQVPRGHSTLPVWMGSLAMASLYPSCSSCPARRDAPARSLRNRYADLALAPSTMPPRTGTGSTSPLMRGAPAPGSDSLSAVIAAASSVHHDSTPNATGNAHAVTS